jgi:hypothetical protein
MVPLAGRTQVMTLADIIIAPTASYQLSFDDVAESSTLDFRDSNLIIAGLAADCCRFSLASFQTVTQVAAGLAERDGGAWSLVKLYYAAFYAGHALIRLFGESCSFLDRRHVNRLSDVGDVLGLVRTFTIEPGLYRCVLANDSTVLSCTRTTGGTHEAFWKIFGGRISTIAQGVLAGALVPAEAQAVFAQLDALSEIIRRRAGHSWLSMVRNDLQYRQYYGVWFPAQIRAGDRRTLSRLATAWQRDPMEIDLDVRRLGLLGEFASCCVFITALCYTMINRIADRSPVGPRSFVQYGPLAYINDIRPRAA